LRAKYSTTCNNLGIVLSALNKNSDSKNFFNEAIETKPNFVDAYINLGVLFAEERNYYEAVTNFEKAIELDPNNYKANFNLLSAKQSIKKLDIDLFKEVNWIIITKYIYVPVIILSILMSLIFLIRFSLYGSQETIETATTTIGLFSNNITTLTTKNADSFYQTMIFIGILFLLIIAPYLLTNMKTLKLSTSGIEFQMGNTSEVDLNID